MTAPDEPCDLELRSKLYAFLGGATAHPDGDVWDHGRLRVLINALMPLVTAYGDTRAADELRAAADAYDEGDGASLACAFFRARADTLDLAAEEAS